MNKHFLTWQYSLYIYIYIYIYIFFFLWHYGSAQAMASSFLGFLIINNDTPQSVGLLWTSDQLVTETSTWQHTTLTTTTNIHAHDGIWTHNLSRWAAADLHFTLCSHWDWCNNYLHSLLWEFGMYYMEHTRQAAQKTYCCFTNPWIWKGWGLQMFSTSQ